MKYRITIILISILLFSCKGQQKDDPTDGKKSVTLVVTNLPSNHDFSKDIYISGDFEGWSGGRDQFKLNKKDEVYSIYVPKYREQINFKFTKGNWESVECQVDGNPIENRTYSFDGKDDYIANFNPSSLNFSTTNEITIMSWFKLTGHSQYDGIVTMNSSSEKCCTYRIMVSPTNTTKT